MSNKFNEIILREHEAQNSAFLDRANKEKVVQGHRITLDLSVARDINNPMEVNFPFKSVFVEQATDPNCFFFVKPSNREDMQKPFRMGLKDSWALPYQIPRCFLHWDQQLGKKIELVFFADAEFRSGSQISVTSGGVSISDGFQFIQNYVTAAANTEVQLLAQNSTRKVSYIHNIGDDPIYLGLPSETIDVSGGSNKFWEVLPNEKFEFRNTAEMWAKSASVLKVKTFEMV
ncbi:MAG: hypothetical protein ACK41T_01080 [Pseudobdellovibrio sp.]